MKYLKVVISFCFFGLMGCESMIQEVPAPDEKPEMVVSCVIVTNSNNIFAEVGMSKPVFGPSDYSDHEKVKDATVIVQSEGESYQLDHLREGFYDKSISSSIFVPGKEFTLNATRPNGLSVSSSCKVPNALRPKVELSMDSNVVESFLFDPMYLYEVSLTDIAGSEDYYQVSGNVLYSDGNTTNIDFGARFRMLDDKDRDGEVIKINGSTFYNRGIEVENVSIYISKVDRNLYYYYQSLNTALDGFSEDVPFLEPTIVPSNIENGVGVFGARHNEYYRFAF